MAASMAENLVGWKAGLKVAPKVVLTVPTKVASKVMQRAVLTAASMAALKVDTSAEMKDLSKVAMMV